MSTTTVPNPPDWRALLLDLIDQTGGSSLLPTPIRLVDLSARYGSPLASVECACITDARALARHLAPTSPAPDQTEPLTVEGQATVRIHVHYRDWWLMVGGTDPAPAELAAACLTPDAPAFPYVSGDLGDR
jgi:hypothetical protein